MLEDPAVHVRWTWLAGDVANWDEAATAHRALVDHFPQRRSCAAARPTVRPRGPGCAPPPLRAVRVRSGA